MQHPEVISSRIRLWGLALILLLAGIGVSVAAIAQTLPLPTPSDSPAPPSASPPQPEAATPSSPPPLPPTDTPSVDNTLGGQAFNAAESILQAVEDLPSILPHLGEGAMSNEQELENPFEKRDINLANAWNISIMFPTSDRRTLAKIIEFLQRKEEMQQAGPTEAGVDADSKYDDILQGILGNVPDMVEDVNETITRPLNIPAFYLQSILYRSSDEWVIWINGTKYTPWNPPEDVTILSVNERFVRMRFTSDQLDWIAPGWQKRDRRHAHVTIDEASGTVDFNLYPNQTFVSRILDVIEGKAKGQTVSVSSDGKQESDDDADMDNAPLFPDDAAEEEEAPKAPSKKPAKKPAERSPANVDKDNAQRMIDMYEPFRKIKP